MAVHKCDTPFDQHVEECKCHNAHTFPDYDCGFSITVSLFEVLLVSKWASSIPGVCSNSDLHTTRGRRACFAGRHRQASFEMEVFRQRKLSLGSLAATLPPRIPVAVQPKPSIPSLCPTRLSVLSNASTSAPIAPQPPATSFCTPDCQAPGTKPSRRRLHSDIIGAAFLVRMQATGSCSRHLSSGDDSSEASSTSTLFSNQGSFLLLQFVWIGPQACDKRGVSVSRWRTSIDRSDLVLPAAHRPAQPWGVGCVACRRSALADPLVLKSLNHNLHPSSARQLPRQRPSHQAVPLIDHPRRHHGAPTTAGARHRGAVAVMRRLGIQELLVS